MRNYWTCTPFADWIRGTPKPKSATSKDWKSWHKLAKTTHAVRYWIAEEFIDSVQKTINKPSDIVRDCTYYYRNRFTTRSNSLTAHKDDIKPGSWRDLGDRIFPCLFNELVNFVEVEKAQCQVIYSEDGKKKYPELSRSIFRLSNKRSKRAGIDYLTWETTLKCDDSETPTQQAKNAQEVLDLYNWYTITRKSRIDPDILSGLSAYYEGRDVLDLLDEKSTEEKDIHINLIYKSHDIQKTYTDEDTLMLKRLIDIRDALWT